MDSGEFVVSADALIGVVVVLFYVLVGLINYRWLIPYLSTACKGLASIILAAQALVILVSLGTQSYPSIDRWLWDLKTEWNIPATLASTQLALVAGIALLTVWFGKGRTAWQRLYLVGTSLVFLFLALDEYFTLHEGAANWKRNYTVLGAALVVATALVAAQLPRRLWKWHICLLAGLAISAAGGILLELLPLPLVCGDLGLLRLDKCLNSFHWEEFLEFIGAWLALVAMLGLFSDVAPTPKPHVSLVLYALPAIWILLLFLNSFVPRLELRLFAQPAIVNFESGVHLRGYRIDNRTGVSIFRLYASARRWKYKGLGYSIHLVDQVSGDSVASHDEWGDHESAFWLLAPHDSPIFRHYMEVEIPSRTPVNQALWIVLTLWRKHDDHFVSQRVLSSDLKLLSESQVVLGELVLPATAPAPSTAPLARFANGFSLGAVDLPERAQPGENLFIQFTWRSSENGREDHMQYLHLGHAESGAWFVYDQQPLGARLPTRLWYSGLADSETWRVALPVDLAPGRYRAFTGLYRMRDQERAPVADAEGVPFVDARVPLGYVTIRSAPP